MRTAPLTLWSFLPPFRKRVEVRAIRLGEFLEMVRLVMKNTAALTLLSTGDRAELLKADWREEAYAFADFVCEGQRPRFFGRWVGRYLGNRNTAALLAASQQAEGEGGWTRILGTLKQPGAPREKGEGGGSIMGDVYFMARTFGLDPRTVLDWPMQFFLDQCAGIKGFAEAASRSAAAPGEMGARIGRDTPPAPLTDWAEMGGGKFLH